MDSMPKDENVEEINNAKYWIDEGDKSYDEDDYTMAKINYKKAIKCCKKAEQLDSNNPSVYFYWGNALSNLAKITEKEKTFIKSFEKYEKATQLNPNYDSAFYNWGIAIFDLAEIKQDIFLYEDANKKYDIATQLDDNEPEAFYNWGLALYRLAENKQNMSLDEHTSLYEYAIEKYIIATQLDKNYASAFYTWGLALYGLAKIKQDESFKNKFKFFEENSEGINDSDTLLIKGELYFFLYQKENNPEYEEKAKVCFIRSKKDILEILTFLDEDNRDKIIITEILHPLLDSNTTRDGKFFTGTVKNKPEEQKKEYKEIYIHSIFIISLLYVNNSNERLVAHYREKSVSQKLLFNNNSKFRLNAIDYSNDPTEGKTLLDFLYGKGNYKTDEELNSEYEAFASSFTFDYDSLNQFRLYGKDGSKKEGTGLSLVFDEDFFDKKAKTAIGSPKTNSYNMNNDDAPKEEKSALFRCIYIDPTPEIKQPIVNVGRKEEYLFYREDIESSIEDIEDKFNNYNTKMNKIIKGVREEMTYLKGLVEKNLNTAIVGKLLLNLRYLVKHIAFKEEQECRIVKIFNLSKDKEKIKDDEFKQLYFEYPLAIPMYIDKIYFGPKAKDFELFKSMLKYKGLNIPCYKSENPLA